ncbi:MAG: glycosidase [Ignavibacteriae bacterium]|nr:glycosidase [Ignavibacteriota bacterium]
MITRSELKLNADPKKVILRFFNLSEKRAKNVIDKVLTLQMNEVGNLLNAAYKEFQHRHRFFEETLNANYKKVEKYIPNPALLTIDQKMLLGSYFSMEYSIEAAALFNPSIVPHPDQSNMNSDNLRFVLSLRATGEGHISSIEFREGYITKNGEVSLYEKSSFSTLPSKTTFSSKDLISKRELGKYFSTDDASNFINTNYSCQFSPNIPISERVLFPYSKNESMGMEDVRFVKYSDLDREIYYGTYTAYNGKEIKTQLVETEDFINFQISTMHGNAVSDKGFALFPRKINGKNVFTSRQDGENLYLMNSDNLYYWQDKEIIRTPQHSWEFIQMGNCGSPIETEQGWLLITHAVGPFRKYVISALLLDLENPAKVIGTLNKPLIEPDSAEREGYVPNVVYSCGSLIHKNNLIIPYAMSDSSCGFAKIEVSQLINKIMKAE